MQTYSKIWVHVIWAVKFRQPLLRAAFRDQVRVHIIERVREEGVLIDMLNGTADHLHCLMRLSPNHAVSKVLHILKGESSRWINTQNFVPGIFAWQRGYSAFSVSESQVPVVREYIASQAEHHRKMSYAEEIERLLQRHGIEIGA